MGKTLGYYLNGKYIKGGQPTRLGRQTTYKEFTHDEQRKAHAADLVQPFKKDGTPNPEFRNLYPEESKDYFNERKEEWEK